MSNCIQEIKTDECIASRDEGYEGCDLWVDEGRSECALWMDRKCHWYSPWNCLLGLICMFSYWIANVICKIPHWFANLVCIAWKYIKKFICVVIDVISSIINAILSVIGILFSIIFGAIFWMLDVLLAIPLIGRLFGWVLNIAKTAVYGILSIPDAVLGLVGIMPEKVLRLLVVIQRDLKGQPTIDDLEVVRRDILFLINTFRTEMNIRVVPVKLFNYKSAFAADTETLSDFIVDSQELSDDLDVCCDACAAGDDLTSQGSRYVMLMSRLGFLGNGRRFYGYGAPITAFSVRSFTDGKLGCSLGPLSDYITIKFNKEHNGHEGENLRPAADLIPANLLDAVTDLAHEVAHSCNLWHQDSQFNLMHGSPARTGNLTRWQKTLVRASRHVTYF